MRFLWVVGFGASGSGRRAWGGNSEVEACGLWESGHGGTIAQPELNSLLVQSLAVERRCTV